MMLKLNWLLRGMAALLLATLVASSVPGDEGDAIVDPDKVGFDYEIQGEYVGDVGTGDDKHRWGAQVIALGNDKFQLEGFFGGLPGDGWSRGDKQETLELAKEGDGASGANDHLKIAIKNDVATLTLLDGSPVGVMKKVHRKSPTLGKEPPADATVLFDGTSADQFERGHLVLGDLLAADCESKLKLGDHSLHLEFRTPFKPEARGQERGNSGVYLQSRYEVQVLDSFGLSGENNECGGIYSIAKPIVNMCFPPLTWQTYDIDFTAARYDDEGKKVKNARATIRHNGVVIHDDLELPHGTPGRLGEGPGPAPLYLQGHGNPVVYRNIWVVTK